MKMIFIIGPIKFGQSWKKIILDEEQDRKVEEEMNEEDTDKEDEEMNECALESIESNDDIGWKIYSMFI